MATNLQRLQVQQIFNTLSRSERFEKCKWYLLVDLSTCLIALMSFHMSMEVFMNLKVSNLLFHLIKILNALNRCETWRDQGVILDTFLRKEKKRQKFVGWVFARSLKEWKKINGNHESYWRCQIAIVQKHVRNHVQTCWKFMKFLIKPSHVCNVTNTYGSMMHLLNAHLHVYKRLVVANEFHEPLSHAYSSL
jgi:hypothetical protein